VHYTQYTNFKHLQNTWGGQWSWKSKCTLGPILTQEVRWNASTVILFWAKFQLKNRPKELPELRTTDEERVIIYYYSSTIKRNRGTDIRGIWTKLGLNWRAGWYARVCWTQANASGGGGSVVQIIWPINWTFLVFFSGFSCIARELIWH